MSDVRELANGQLFAFYLPGVGEDVDEVYVMDLANLGTEFNAIAAMGPVTLWKGDILKGMRSGWYRNVGITFWRLHEHLRAVVDRVLIARFGEVGSDAYTKAVRTSWSSSVLRVAGRSLRPVEISAFLQQSARWLCGRCGTHGGHEPVVDVRTPTISLPKIVNGVYDNDHADNVGKRRQCRQR